MAMFRKHLIPLVVLAAALAFSTIDALAGALSSTAIRGDRIFTFPVLKASGGVILQKPATFVDSTGVYIAVTKLSLRRDGAKYCVIYQEACYRIPADQDVIAPLAKWISRGQTVAFSMVVYNDDKDANDFVKGNLRAVQRASVIQACQHEGDPCFTAPEFVGSSLEDMLYSLDFATFYEPTPNEEKIMARLNGKDAKGCGFLDSQTFSYVNTDVDSDFVVTLSNGTASIRGALYRYGWRKCTGSTRPYIYAVSKLSEQGAQDEPTYSQAVKFAQVAALLRAFEERSGELSKLVTVH
jgi:hypothetical protein